VIIVSDEEDCSDDGALDGFTSSDCYKSRAHSSRSPTSWIGIQGVKLNNEFVQIGSIVGPFDDSCPDAHSGRRYAEAALLTGGLRGKICDASWDTMLFDLGLNAIGILDAFTLSQPADEESIHVFVDPQNEAPEFEVPIGPLNGWTYDWTSQLLQFYGTSVPVRGSAGPILEHDADLGTVVRPRVTCRNVAALANGPPANAEAAAWGAADLTPCGTRAWSPHIRTDRVRGLDGHYSHRPRSRRGARVMCLS